MTADVHSPAPAEQPAASSAAPPRKPRFALFVATAAGLGYLPLAPGTFGSLAGLLLALVPLWGIVGLIFIIFSFIGPPDLHSRWISLSSDPVDFVFCAQIALTILVAAIGVWSANRAAKFWASKDPQRVVIDEVSGQHLALLLGCALPIARALGPGAYTYSWQIWPIRVPGLITASTALNWKYLLLGFILFRVFDIWKPFPVRQAESLPGGWGIMADDWVAGIYAALGLWIARAAGL